MYYVWSLAGSLISPGGTGSPHRQHFRGTFHSIFIRRHLQTRTSWLVNSNWQHTCVYRLESSQWRLEFTSTKICHPRRRDRPNNHTVVIGPPTELPNQYRQQPATRRCKQNTDPPKPRNATVNTRHSLTPDQATPRHHTTPHDGPGGLVPTSGIRSLVGSWLFALQLYVKRRHKVFTPNMYKVHNRSSLLRAYT